ncbi:hypothetical protein BDN72DRAFT_862034 [Pluteus cervinus]|uniref:Uncharacterized protein n=1 Tax=Pluteus cervinus TaxID=181527 RepID=A0ACD3AD31_9AGAR|nr:hypothetical protein BDN72DRAFT_862034 [Pluteus cervinus]
MTLAYKCSDLSTLGRKSGISAHLNLITSITLSPNGRWLACGDEGGVVSITALSPQPRVTQYLRADSTIRSLVWHPVSKTPSLVAGAQNGDVWFLRLTTSGKLDHFNQEQPHFTINGRIDAMSISSTGRQLAIGYSGGIAILDGPFVVQSRRQIDNWPPQQFLRIPRDGGSIRNMHYLGEGELIVTFLSGPHIMAYSTVQLESDAQDETDRVIWTLRVRRIPFPSLDIGSSAVSPDGKLLAVANLKDGIDWYDLDHQHYMCTTLGDFGKVDGKTKYAVGLAFLDNESVVVVIQLVTVALRDGMEPIIVASCGSNTRFGRHWELLFVEKTRAFIGRTISMWFSSHFKMVAIVLILIVALLRTNHQDKFSVSTLLDYFVRVLRSCTCPYPCFDPASTVTLACVTGCDVGETGTE